MKQSAPRHVGRYELCGEIAAGGMATIHLGRAQGAPGTPLAIKRLREEYARDPDFLSMFLDEARLLGRVRHPNVVEILEVLMHDGELFLVMPYVHGATLAHLAVAAEKRSQPIPLPVLGRIAREVLAGLEAAHAARDERGEPLHIIHRDISPQNMLVGVDGVARLLDFGVAKASTRLHTTRGARIKGKLAYLAPEVLAGDLIDHRLDIYSMGVVLWEACTGRRLFTNKDHGVTIRNILTLPVPRPSELAPWIPGAVDAVILRALHRTPSERFATAAELSVALRKVLPSCDARTVSRWVSDVGVEILVQRERVIAGAHVFADFDTVVEPSSVRAAGSDDSAVSTLPDLLGHLPITESAPPSDDRVTLRPDPDAVATLIPPKRPSQSGS